MLPLDSARAGVQIVRVLGRPIAVVALAYGLGGLAGALYAPFAGFANTELLFWLLSGQVVIMVIIGGSGTLIGPILGANSILLLDGERHFRERRLMGPPLHGERMHVYGRLMQEIADRVIDAPADLLAL